MILAAVLAAAVGGCAEGGSRSARAQLQQTFGPRGSVTSGVIDVAFALTTDGGAGAGQPAGERLALRVRGPFESLGPARLPRFALRLDLGPRTRSAPGGALHAGATATGDRLFIELGGRQFLAPDAVLQALRRGYVEEGGGASRSRRPGVAMLGLDPRAWLTHPRVVGSGRLAGVQVTHIRAGVDVASFLADARRLSAAVAALGIGPGATGPDRLAAEPAGPVRAARADVFAGTRDQLLRRLALHASIAPTAQAPPRAGASGATLSLTITLSGLDQPQRILAPSRPRPILQLPATLARLGLARSGRG